MKQNSGYSQLLSDKRFEAFLWTQLLGAFNDNLFKMIVSLVAVSTAAAPHAGSQNLALAGAVFVLPFLLFAGYAGHIADRFSKTRVLQITKSFEIFTMLLALPALVAGRMDWLLIILFLLATQANFFSPAKYGILPEMLDDARLTRANGLLELTTFTAIVFGTSFGTLLYEHWKGQPLRIGLVLLGIAVTGSLVSLAIQKVPPARTTNPFHWNPLHEIAQGVSALRVRPALAMTVVGLSWFWFIGGLFQMALLLAGTEVLHVSETWVGLLVTALAVGIGAGSVAAGSLSGDYIELGMVPLGAGLMGAFSFAAGLTDHYWFMVVCLIAIGFGGGLFAVPLNALLQKKADTAERGRLMATNNFANMLGVILASAVLWFTHDRLGWSASTIFSVLGAGIFVGSVYLTIRMREAVLRFVLWGLATVLFRVHMEGQDNIPATGPALLVSNHISYADPVLVGYLSRKRTMHFLMWQPIFDLPVANHLFRALRAIPISGDSPKSTIRALQAARAELAHGELVAIFPEGAISLTGETGEFGRGFDKVRQGNDAPVIPIHIHGLYGHPFSYKGGGPFRSWQNLWRPVVTVRVGAPVWGRVTPDELRLAVTNA